MAFSNVRWITFDAGGTLLFPNPSVGDIYSKVLMKHGHSREPALLEEWFFRAWREDVRKCMAMVTPESEKKRWRGVVHCTFAELSGLIDIDKLFDDLWAIFRDASSWRLPDYAEETLSGLRDRGYRLAILSNWDDRLRPLMQGIGLDRHFEEIFVSCEVGFEKPDARIFSAVEKRLGATGDTLLHIGDSHHHDVLGAEAAGWRAVQVFSPPPDGFSCKSVNCLSELLELLPERAGTQT